MRRCSRNLQPKIQDSKGWKFFPVVLHNLSGYDSHLFIKTSWNSEGYISCIQNNEENYISFTKHFIVDKFVNEEGKDVNVKRELRFIDSFMASTLDRLSSNLKIFQFANFKKYYCGNQFSLLLRNGVYPYDYVDCMKKLDGTSLPPKEEFLSKLTVKVLQMKITSMLTQFGRNLILSQWRITTIYTICLMYYY